MYCLYLARSILESGANAPGTPIRYQADFRVSERSSNPNDYSFFNEDLDLVTYPVGKGIIYEMIYRRDRHKREYNRIKKKSEGKKKWKQKENIEIHRD